MILLYVPFPNHDMAVELSQKAFEGNLVACVNVLPKVTSLYRWLDEHGKEILQSSCEVIALFKTTKECAQKLQEFIESHHPYDCPAILTIPIDANPMFKDWVNDQCNLPK